MGYFLCLKIDRMVYGVHTFPVTLKSKCLHSLTSCILNCTVSCSGVVYAAYNSELTKYM